MSYYVCRCLKCGKYSGTLIKDIRKKTFKCPYCNTSLKLKKVNGYGTATKVLGPYKVTDIPRIVAHMNDKKK